MLDAKSAPLIAFKYSVCSGVQAEGPAGLEVEFGVADSAVDASELEQADSPRDSAVIITIARTLLCFEPIFNTS